MWEYPLCWQDCPSSAVMDTTTNMQSTAEDYTKPYCIDYSDCSVCEIPIVGKIWCEFVFWKICLLGLEISPNSMFI